MLYQAELHSADRGRDIAKPGRQDKIEAPPSLRPTGECGNSLPSRNTREIFWIPALDLAGAHPVRKQLTHTFAGIPGWPGRLVKATASLVGRACTATGWAASPRPYQHVGTLDKVAGLSANDADGPFTMNLGKWSSHLFASIKESALESKRQ